MSPASARPHARRVRFAGAQGHDLVGGRFEPAGPPKGVVLLLHGGGQTRHAWDATATRLALAGFLAVAIDQRGHGDSAWIPERAYTFAITPTT